MRFRQFLDNYRIWKGNRKVRYDGKYREYEKGDGIYILFHSFLSLVYGLIFLIIMAIIIFSIAL